MYPIRDFVYLDVERLLSFVAQVGKGLVSEQTTKSARDLDVQASAGINLGIFNAGTNPAAHWGSETSETRTAHDHVYFDQFHTALQTTKAYVDLELIGPDEWIEERFPDGWFILAKGILKITDYEYVKHRLASLPRRYDAIKELGPVTENSKNRRTVSAFQAEYGKLPLKQLTNYLQQFYGDTIRIEHFPYPDIHDRFLVGSAKKELFRYTTASLSDMYGPAVDAGWYGVFQVHLGQPHAPGEIVHTTKHEFLNHLENALDRFYEMTGSTKLINTSQFSHSQRCR
jgi:hypothetical protein